MPGLSNGENGIQVDMRFDQGGREQAPPSVDDIGWLGGPGGRRGRDLTALDGN